MYLCKVGIDFKVDFFKRFLNFCYDKKNGIVYSNELNIFEKLGIDKDFVEEVCNRKDLNEEEIISLQNIKDVCNEIINKNNKINNNELLIKQISSFKIELETLKKEKVLFKQIIKNLFEFQKEIISQEEENFQQNQEEIKIIKKSIGILNKKNKETNEFTETLKLKIEAIIELLSEQVAKSKIQLPNILKTNMTLEKIWNSTEDKSSAAILSIMLMIKKALEEKGIRL